MAARKHEYGVGFLIWHVALRFRAEVDRTLEPLGLTHTQFAVLVSLHAMTQRGMSPNQRALADHCGVDPMHVSKIVRALQAAELIERKPDPADPRAYLLAPTRLGGRTAEKAFERVQALQSRLMAPLPAPRRAAFRADLELLLTAHGWPRGSEILRSAGAKQ